MVHARHAVASILRGAHSAAIARESRTRFAASASAIPLGEKWPAALFARPPKGVVIGGLLLSASLSWGPQAHAQQAPASSGGGQEQTQQLQEVEVTGSRIKRTSDFTTPTPTTVLDTTAMDNAGVVNVGQALQMAPANLSSFTPASTGNSAFFTGAYIPNLRGLNPYFGSRTLTLIDTQRVVQTNQGDSFDMNFIPQVLVSRIDTVTGGGSAAYGSGAIAGVINVMLDRQLEGGKVAGDLYQTNDSDGRDRHLGAAYGFGIADDRVHIVLGGEYEKQDPVGCETARSWCAQNKGFYQSGITSGSQATYSLGTNLRTAVMSTTGVLSGFALPTTTLTQGNSLGTGGTTYTPGTTAYAGAYSGSTVEGGDGNTLNQYTQLMAGTTRGVLSALITAKVTDDINLKVDLNWGKVESTAAASNLSEYSTINADNAYIQGTSLTTAVANGNTYLFKDWTSQVDQHIYTSTTVKRVSVGLDGHFGDSSWTWNGYAEYGLTNRLQYEPNEVHATSLAYALDAVTDTRVGSSTYGQTVCRVTLTGSTDPLAAGCVPINPFGTQALSSAQLAYAFGSLEEELRYEQTVVAFNSSGDIFQGVGAGAWSAAVGAEWRQEVGNNLDNDRLGNGCAASIGITSAAECLARATDFSAQYGTSFGGRTTVEEGYLELNLPLLKDLPFARRLDLDIAGRESHYQETALYGAAFTDYTDDPGAFPEAPVSDATHNLTTWKASLAWEPVEGVRLRASQSRDARAPNFRELYYGQTLKSGAEGGYYGYCQATGESNYYTNPCDIHLYGNTNLAPETSDTTTLGVVLTPAQLPGLQFSADWIHVHIANAISQANYVFTEQQVIQNIKNGGNGLVSSGSMTWNTGTGAGQCGTILTCMNDWLAGGSGDVLSVNSTSYNGAYYDERAVDFSVSYLLPSLPDGSSLSARALTTWTSKQEFQSYAGGQVYDLLGQNGGNAMLNDFTPAPRWRGNLSLTWTKGILSLTPMMTWVGHGTLLNNGVTPQQTELYEYVASGKASAAGQSYVLLPFNYVPSYFKFDMNATLDFGSWGVLKDLQVYTQVSNLLNKAPPFAAAPSGGLFGTGGVAGTNATLYDTLGLAYRVGFRATF